MRRIAPLVAACLLVVGLAVSLPGRCLACSCAAPATLAEAVTRSPELAVFAGSVVAMEAGSGGVATVRVEGRFRGPLFSATIRARYGGGGDCTIGMAVGERRLFTAFPDERGVWFPALCNPQGILGTPEGDALLAEAIRTFGPAQPVGGPPATAPPGADLVVLATVAALILGAGFLLVVGVTVAAHRGRRDAR